jgi:hypothetical protein
MTGRRSRICSSISFSTPTRSRRRGSPLDLDATDDPVHGSQEGRFFHGYYDCYCYLPLYVFCGDHLLAAKLRRANIDASAGSVEEIARIVTRIRAAWPRVKVLLRADGGFAREELMAWAEANDVDYVFGLARNARLVDRIYIDLAWAEEAAQRSGRPERRFADFRWTTKLSWSRRRRVVAKAEWLPGRGEAGANPRFVVTSLKPREIAARTLYEKLLSYDFSRLPRQKGATARHASYGGQWRGSDREKLGRLWRRAVVGSPPSSSSVLNGYPGSRPG